MAVTKTIDLNADLGEDESDTGIARDLAIMDIISSCNIACGGHAGSPENMVRMLRAAKEKHVSAGAHPSYPDRENFGRISLDISSAVLLDALKSQLADIRAASEQTGSALHHIKPHGALYNDAQDDETLSEILIEIAQSEMLPLIGMSQSVLEGKAKLAGVPYIAEAFIDRRYTEEIRLVPRSKNGAVIEKDSERLDQALALASGNDIKTVSGQHLRVSAQTLCLHSDSDGALETAKVLRSTLEEKGFSIEAVTVD